MSKETVQDVAKLLRELFGVPAKTIEEVRERFQELADSLPAAECAATVEPADAGGVSGVWVCAEGVRSGDTVFFLHGGGYNCGSTTVYRDFMIRMSQICDARVLGIDYRLAPEHKFPAALDDAVAAYRWLLRETPAERVVFAGDSAGGGLVLATLLRLRDEGINLPRAAVCISPWTDLEGLGESCRTKAEVDPWIRPERILTSTRLYVREEDFRHPLAAPLYGDPAGLPPLMILVGSEETLLDDSTRFAALAEAAGVDVRLEVWEGMIHVWPFFAGMLQEGMEAFGRMNEFYVETLKARA